ncbi:MAG: hypothetical protein PHD76_06415 [Methylacidiphilales bacterium]|nr:hypothetical protein [Candidatus Methylacidiphilales bacterium]
MRTTLTLEPDVAAKLSNCTAKLKKPTKTVVNEALRIGLEKLAQPIQAKPYKTKSHAFGFKLQGHSVADWIAAAEGDDYK